MFNKKIKQDVDQLKSDVNDITRVLSDRLQGVERALIPTEYTPDGQDATSYPPRLTASEILMRFDEIYDFLNVKRVTNKRRSFLSTK